MALGDLKMDEPPVAPWWDKLPRNTARLGLGAERVRTAERKDNHMDERTGDRMATV